MNRRTRRNLPNSEIPAYLRYLKPGALAQLRDSRISTRTHRVHSRPSQISSSPLRSSPPAATEQQIGAVVFEGPPSSPCFSGRMSGPRCLQRKKLAAAKSFCFAGTNPPGPGPIPDPMVDFFSTTSDNNSHNILAAH